MIYCHIAKRHINSLFTVHICHEWIDLQKSKQRFSIPTVYSNDFCFDLFELERQANTKLPFVHSTNIPQWGKSVSAVVQVNNYKIVIHFFHISHNLTWYSAIAQSISKRITCITYIFLDLQVPYALSTDRFGLGPKYFSHTKIILEGTHIGLNQNWLFSTEFWLLNHVQKVLIKSELDLNQ